MNLDFMNLAEARFGKDWAKIAMNPDEYCLGELDKKLINVLQKYIEYILKD